MKIVYFIAAVIFATAFAGTWIYNGLSVQSDKGNCTPQRIVSLSPSVTESLYFLGLGDKIVAVSRYCEYPPEARTKPKTGGIHDVNYEAAAAMRPDIVILSHMQTDARERFDNLGIKTLLLNQESFQEVLDSLWILGKTFGVQTKADELICELKNSAEGIIARVAPYRSKKTLFVVSRDAGSGKIANVVVAGNDGFYSGILELLHAENPFSKYIAYSTVSKEGLYWVNPEVIIELLYFPEHAETSFDEWSAMSNLTAVKNRHVCSITDSYGYTPGPRFPLLLDTVARCIYPEAFQ